MRHFFAFLALCSGLEACASPAAPDAPCQPVDDRRVFALTVAPRDSASGAWLTAVVRAEDGAYVAVLVPGLGVPGGPPASYSGIEERPGTYTVTATAPGYRAWSREGIVIALDAMCHVQPIGLTALLQLNGQ